MTVGDLILKVKADEQTKDDAVTAVQAATVALDTATKSLDQDEAQLGQVLTTTGPVFVIEADGTASIYAPDGTGSYHVTVAKPADTDAGV